MATLIPTGELKKAFGHQCAWPTLQSMENAIRSAKHTASAARNATEDFVSGTELEIRRHPLTAVGFAAAAGLATGVAVGFAGAWFWRYSFRREGP